MKVFLTTIALLGLTLCLGCESNAPTSTGERFEMGAPPPPTPAAAGEPAAAAVAKAPAADAPAADGNPPAPVAAAAGTEPAVEEKTEDDAEGGTLKKAEVGVGKKGKDYGGPGFITTPVAAKFTIEERIAFDVQIPKAMQLYKAEHNNKGPKTQEEFFDKIIKEHGVQLPVLFPGESYVYVPETEEMMVKSPEPKK